MKIKELLYENKVGSLQDDVADALPATYVFPELKNNDAYSQYRMGMAIAAARRLFDEDPYHISSTSVDFAPASAWGENLVAVAYEKNPDTRILDLAAKLVGVQKKLISTPNSKESSDVSTRSPITPVK